MRGERSTSPAAKPICKYECAHGGAVVKMKRVVIPTPSVKDEGRVKRSTGPRSMRFSGAIATSGNSLAIRMEKALTRADKAFGMTGRAVRFDIIGPGKALVTVEGSDGTADDDPMIDAWLGFLMQDSIDHPEHLHLLGEAEAARLRKSVEGVVVSDDDEIPVDVTF